MSDIKMCDNPQCGRLFSVNETGWSTSTRTLIRPQEDHLPTRPTMTIDLCNLCTGGSEVPRPALDPGRARPDYRADDAVEAPSWPSGDAVPGPADVVHGEPF